MRIEAERRLTILVKLAAIYLIASGVIGLLFPLINEIFIHSPQHHEYAVKSLTYKVSSYSRMYALNFLYLISGIGLLLGKSWARKMALVIIVITTIYSVNEAAWGWARGRPDYKDYFIGFVFIVPWKTFLFWVVLKWKDQKVQDITT